MQHERNTPPEGVRRALANAGSEDSTVRVWDLHSGQALRVMTQAKGPVSCLLAVPKSWLSADSMAPHPTSGRTRTPLPLASFAKYQTPAGSAPTVVTGSAKAAAAAAAPGGGALVVLPLTAPPKGWLRGVERHGFVDGAAEERRGGAGSGGGGEGVRRGGSKRKAAAAAAADGDEEAARLREQLQEAHAEIAKWKKLHAELHAFCVEEVLDNPPPSKPS